MSANQEPSSEDLLADALAAFDAGGEPALAAFVDAHPAQATVLQRGIARCRQMGLLAAPPSDSFPERLDDFRLLRRIGGGGMGVVYEAEQLQLGRRVALKVIRPELLYFEGARERFRREVDAIAKLSHPAIVPVLASGEHEGVPYFAMELLTGVTAEEACNALRGRDPSTLTGADLRLVVDGSNPGDDTSEAFAGAWWQACTRFVHQVALGMRHAHLRGIVHRDLKPSNVMLTPHGQAIVLDFGIAKVDAGRELTRSGATPGSPAFMSPEQVRGEATDERTDVYSLGATLWQMLTLQRPFADAKLHEHIQRGHLPSLRGRNRSVPRELELVLRTAMDRDRERRYGDMGGFAADLLAVLQRKPIAARPLGAGLRALRWCQRHRVAATALAALAIGGAVVLGALAWQQRAANAILSAEQTRTRQSLETTLDALHAVLVRLGNEGLRAVPLAEQIAHEALTDAAELYRKLLVQHPDHDRVRIQGGRALHALAMSFERQGKTEEALATVHEAIAALQDPRTPVSASLLDVRACAGMSLASLLADTKDVAGAEAAIAAAERDFVAASENQRYLAAALRGRANLQTTRSILVDERTQPAAAEAALREAVRLHDEAMAQGPPDAKDATQRVTYLTNLAKFLNRQDRDSEARPLLERALVHAKELPSSAKSWPPPAVTVAEIQECLGNLLSRQKLPDAESYLRASLDSREQLLAKFPNTQIFRIQLGGTLHNFGAHVLREGRIEEALAWFERARQCQQQALAKTPNNFQCRLFLTNHLQQIGKCQVQLERGRDVLATARALTAANLVERDASFRSAQLFMHAQRLLAGQPTDGEATDHAEAAMQQLLRAEQHGFDDVRELDAPLFAPLHEHREWNALRERVVARRAARPTSAGGVR